MLNEQIKKPNPQVQLIRNNTVTYLITCFFIYDQFFFQNDSMMRVIRNLTVHDAIAGISLLVLEMYPDSKELFIESRQ